MTEIRNGVVVESVPDNPRINRLRVRQAELQATIERCRREKSKISSAAQELDSRIQLTNDLKDLARVSEERETLKARYEDFDLQERTAEAEIQRVNEEVQSWLSNFASWQYRRRELIRELAVAVDGPAEYDFAIERDIPRTRGQVELELQNINQKLEGFSR
jgi:chromosome segregation ATPase